MQAIRSATSQAELQAVLRNRVAEPLRQEAKATGRRATLHAAGLIAISPHARWDGIIAGLRGLLIIRDVARLFGLRPGPLVTLLLVHKVAWTTARYHGHRFAVAKSRRSCS
jgi:putative membrane protein